MINLRIIISIVLMGIINQTYTMEDNNPILPMPLFLQLLVYPPDKPSLMPALKLSPIAQKIIDLYEKFENPLTEEALPSFLIYKDVARDNHYPKNLSEKKILSLLENRPALEASLHEKHGTPRRNDLIERLFYIAIRNNKVAEIKFFLENKIDYSRIHYGFDFESPIQLAERYEKNEILKLLKDYSQK